MLALEEKIKAAKGELPIDVFFRNGKLINVLSGEIHLVDFAVKSGIVVGFGQYDADDVVDLAGKYICPGLIDGHVHIESSMVAPGEFAKAIVPRGTTTIVADPHEIANVCGIDGIEYMLEASKDLALRVYFMLPSSVPATKMETSGAHLTAFDLHPFLDRPMVLGLGELMDFPAVMQTDQDMMAKLRIIKNRPVDGHAPGITGKQLAAYVISGVGSEHECTTPEEAMERLRLGMKIMVRDGSAAKNLKDLLPMINQYTTRRCMLVTDDRHPEDLVREGHIDHLVRTSIKGGIDPILAIQMATINAAEWFGLKNLGALAPGYQADFLVLDSLEEFKVGEVYRAGIKVAEKGKAIFDSKIHHDSKVLNTIRLPNWRVEEIAEKLRVSAFEGKSNVIGLIPHQIITENRSLTLPQLDGFFVSSSELDLVKIAVFERHYKSGRVGIGFLQGLGLTHGAIASSVAHDSHNIVVVGMTDADMAVAVKAIEAGGGGIAVVAEGKVLGAISLQIAGLMSELSLAEVDSELQRLQVLARGLGVKEEYDPFMTLAFLALPVIPELKISDYGLIDVTKMKLVNPITTK